MACSHDLQPNVSIFSRGALSDSIVNLGPNAVPFFSITTGELYRWTKLGFTPVPTMTVIFTPRASTTGCVVALCFCGNCHLQPTFLCYIYSLAEIGPIRTFEPLPVWWERLSPRSRVWHFIGVAGSSSLRHSRERQFDPQSFQSVTWGSTVDALSYIIRLGILSHTGSAAPGMLVL